MVFWLLLYIKMIVKIPDFLRELREPWLKGVDSELQRHIRFNTELTPDGSIYDYLSGGGGTIIGKNIDEKTFHELERLTEREYFSREFDDSEYSDFKSFLKERGVDLSLRLNENITTKDFPDLIKRVVPKEVFLMTKDIYELIPNHHFGHEHFKELRLSGWGHGAAKCSEYDNPTVHMFTFAVRGARTNYSTLLLHETGHAHLESLDDTSKKGLAECLKDIRKMPGNFYSLFAVDYLFGVNSRAKNALGNLEEFAAETYLLYVVRGVELKKTIDRLPGEFKKPWKKLYDIFHKSFQVEYE